MKLAEQTPASHPAILPRGGDNGLASLKRNFTGALAF